MWEAIVLMAFLVGIFAAVLVCFAFLMLNTRMLQNRTRQLQKTVELGFSQHRGLPVLPDSVSPLTRATLAAASEGRDKFSEAMERLHLYSRGADDNQRHMMMTTTTKQGSVDFSDEPLVTGFTPTFNETELGFAYEPIVVRPPVVASSSSTQKQKRPKKEKVVAAEPVPLPPPVAAATHSSPLIEGGGVLPPPNKARKHRPSFVNLDDDNAHTVSATNTMPIAAGRHGGGDTRT